MAALISVVIISKDEPALAETLDCIRAQRVAEPVEVIIVDASDGRLDYIRDSDPSLHWIRFESRSPAKRTTIPEQRNVGVRSASGSVIVFIDAGCIPESEWLRDLTVPILTGREVVTVGRTLGKGAGNVFIPLPAEDRYLEEAPTVNLAFTRSAFDCVDGFDEDFDYGSDIDFTWRLVDAGKRLRLVPSALVTSDWGNTRRQLKRARHYGEARARLYMKHPRRVRGMWRRDPVLFVYPAYLILLPLSIRRSFRWLPFLLIVPWWHARHRRPTMTVIDHLVFGAGALEAVWKRVAYRTQAKR